MKAPVGTIFRLRENFHFDNDHAYTQAAYAMEAGNKPLKQCHADVDAPEVHHADERVPVRYTGGTRALNKTPELVSQCRVRLPVTGHSAGQQFAGAD